MMKSLISHCSNEIVWDYNNNRTVVPNNLFDENGKMHLDTSFLNMIKICLESGYDFDTCTQGDYIQMRIKVFNNVHKRIGDLLIKWKKKDTIVPYHAKLVEPYLIDNITARQTILPGMPFILAANIIFDTHNKNQMKYNGHVYFEYLNCILSSINHIMDASITIQYENNVFKIIYNPCEYLHLFTNYSPYYRVTGEVSPYVKNAIVEYSDDVIIPLSNMASLSKFYFPDDDQLYLLNTKFKEAFKKFNLASITINTYEGGRIDRAVKKRKGEKNAKNHVESPMELVNLNFEEMTRLVKFIFGYSW